MSWGDSMTSVAQETGSEWLIDFQLRSSQHWWWAGSWFGSIENTYSLPSLCSTVNSVGE